MVLTVEDWTIVRGQAKNKAKGFWISIDPKSLQLLRLLSNNVSICNKGNKNKPTFFNRIKEQVIDIRYY